MTDTDSNRIQWFWIRPDSGPDRIHKIHRISGDPDSDAVWSRCSPGSDAFEVCWVCNDHFIANVRESVPSEIISNIGQYSIKLLMTETRWRVFYRTILPRDAQSALCGIAIVSRPSVCPSVRLLRWGDWKCGSGKCGSGNVGTKTEGECRGGKCGSGNIGTVLQGWKMRESRLWNANRIQRAVVQHGVNRMFFFLMLLLCDVHFYYNLLVQAYCIYVWSLLEYCSAVWSPHLKHLIL